MFKYAMLTMAKKDGIMKYGNKEKFNLKRMYCCIMKRVWILITLTLVAIVMAGCLEENVRETPSSGILVNLTIDKAPALNETAELKLSMTAPRNASNARAKILLPEGLVFLSGDLSWNGELIENRTQSIHAKVRAVKTGNWTIIGAAGGNDYIYLSIQENEGYITESPLKNFTRGKKYAEAK